MRIRRDSRSLAGLFRRTRRKENLQDNFVERRRKRRCQLESLEARRVLATFQVVAETPDGEPGSLRAAIVAANQNNEDDVIELAEGTYQLTLPRVNERYTRDDEPTILNAVGGDLDLTEKGFQITIRGLDAASTVIDASLIRDRVFDIATDVDAVIEGVTIQGGNGVTAGGGINAGRDVDPFEADLEDYGSLTIRNATVRNNTASYEGGGLNHWGKLVVENSRFINNESGYEGGGMDHGGGGTATIIDSSFIGNRADYEGGGVGTGTRTVSPTAIDITGTTFADNYANYSGGGVDAGATTVTIANSTFSNNRARHQGDSLNVDGGSASLEHVTAVHGSSPSNSGMSGVIRASNSIFTGHRRTDIGESFRSLGSNFIAVVGDHRLRGDDGTNILGGDPRLGSLADNGGPTLTHRPLLDSPLIDRAIAESTLEIDQRGEIRPNDGDGDGVAIGDIGAFESPTLQVFRVNSTRDDVDINPGNGVVDTNIEGEITLRGAVMEANALNSSVRIELPSGNFKLDQGRTDNNSPDEDFAAEDDLDLYGQIVISGEGDGTTIIDGSRQSGIFEIHETAEVVIRDLTMTNGFWNSGIVNYGQAEIRDATISNNRAIPTDTQGGGITNFGIIRVVTTEIFGNSSGSSGVGGGIANLGTANIDRSTIADNSSGATGRGGAIYNEGIRLSVTSSTISGNSSGANGRGGGLFVENGHVEILSSTIVGNSTTAGGDRGGGITIAENAEVRIGNTIIAQNDAGDVAGDFDDAGHNFIGGDPILGSLADNGGPTRTHLPQSGSPVIDAGSNFGFATDQRGFDRTFDDPRVENSSSGMVDDANHPSDHPADGTDIGSVEATYELTKPEANSDHFYAFGAFQSNGLQDQITTVLANDIWLVPLSAELVEPPRHGVVLLSADGSFTYLPNVGFRGQDEFTYVAVQRDGLDAAGEPIRSEPATVVIDIVLAASISGQSYIDRDNDGIFDGTDSGLAQTQFRLVGTDRWGNQFSRQATSNSRGEYRFDDLPPGSYIVRKQQPELLKGGKISLGNAGGEIEDRHSFSIRLEEGTVAANYRFAELIVEDVPERIEERVVGDSNGDGVFDSSDLVFIFQRSNYEDPTATDLEYADGDWNGDGIFDSSDFVFAFQFGAYEETVDSSLPA